MNFPFPTFKCHAAMLLLAILITISCVSRTSAQKASGLTPQESRGKQIYTKGESLAGDITALLGNSGLEVPASSFSCANCHGRRGEGTSEGGIQPPPLTWETLTWPHTSTLTRRERPAYTEVTLARAISDALDSAGVRLHPAMPNYRMTREQMGDLIAYLKQLGKDSDADPGVTDETIRIGTVLPLSGPLAQVGEDVKTTLLATFAELNAEGGIYGRRCELIVEDSRGDSAQTLEATRRLIDGGNVFAMLSNFEPGDSFDVNRLIKINEIPLIGPLTLSPRLMVPPNPYVFYLLPTFSDQVRTLLDFATTKSRTNKAGPPRLAVVHDSNSFNVDAVLGLKAQAAMYGLEIASEQAYRAPFKSAETVQQLSAAKPDYIFFFGAADDLKALGMEMDRAKLNVPLMTSVMMAGRAAFSLPPGVAAQTFLAYPSAFPNQEDFAPFLALAKKGGFNLRSPAFQSMAYASAKVFFEAAKLTGKQINRAALINSLEQMRDFKTGVIPSVSFGPNRRVGSNGSSIVGIDVTKQQYVLLTERMSPKDKP